MSKKSIAVLKTYFETGDRPTEQQFADLIDSFIHKDNAGVTITAKSYNETTGVLSFSFSDSTTITATIPQSASISFITELQDILDDKVDKEAGKGLSTNDYDGTEKAQVATNKAHTENDSIHVSAGDRTNWDGKVDSEAGKGLSTNDYDGTEKAQVATNKAHTENDSIHVGTADRLLWSNKFKKWGAGQYYALNAGDVFRINKGDIYELTITLAEYPFNTADFDAEQAAGKWTLVLKGKNTIFVFGREFELIKHPTNNTAANYNTLENNDIIANNYFDTVTFWSKAQCIDAANKDLEVSWVALETIDELILI